MEHQVEKLLYSREDAAEALSLCVRSIDYLIETGELSKRRIGGRVLIPAKDVRRYASEDHPENLRKPVARECVPRPIQKRA
jgi:excisionase family DNA binding protein